MPILLIAEHDNRTLSEQTSRALTAARAMGAEVHVLVAGLDVQGVGEAASQLEGVGKVLVADAKCLEHRLAEPLGELVLSHARGYTAILAPASSMGRSVLPRVAALLDVMQISDVVAVEGPSRFKRPIYAGNAIQTVESADEIKVLTVRTSSFQPAAAGGTPAPIESLGFSSGFDRTRHLGSEIVESARPDLTAARIVVSGGRALGSREQFDALIVALADRLGAAPGASRAAVDAGYAPNDWQVGQTGKIVAPELYIACGISGAIQHLAGMKGSRVIVAINSDADAPIFEIADYGLVADLFKALPELADAV